MKDFGSLKKKRYHLIQLSINIPALPLALAYPAVTQNIEKEQAYFKKKEDSLINPKSITYPLILA